MSKKLLDFEPTERRLRVYATHRYLLGKSIEESSEFAAFGRAGVMPISGGGEVAFRKIQAGLETTRGTAVAATRKVYGVGQINRVQPPIRPTSEDRGTLVRNYRSQPGLISAELNVNAAATFEDLPWWLQLALKGGVTGTVTGVTGYKYDFIGSASVDDLKSGTFEQGDDTQAWQMPFGMIDSWSITGTLGTPWMFDAKIIGADGTPVTFTAALSDRVVEDIEGHLSKLALGAVGAVPSSFMTGRFIGFKLDVNNHLARKYFMDQLASPVMGGVGRQDREIRLEVTQEGNAATVAERANYVAGTARVARIQATGTAIAGGTAIKTAEIIVPGKWATWVQGARDTNTIFTAVLESEYDAVLAHELEVFVINSLVTLP